MSAIPLSCQTWARHFKQQAQHFRLRPNITDLIHTVIIAIIRCYIPLLILHAEGSRHFRYINSLTLQGTHCYYPHCTDEETVSDVTQDTEKLRLKPRPSYLPALVRRVKAEARLPKTAQFLPEASRSPGTGPRGEALTWLRRKQRRARD